MGEICEILGFLKLDVAEFDELGVVNGGLEGLRDQKTKGKLA